MNKLSFVFALILFHCTLSAQVKPDDIPIESSFSHVFYSDNDVASKMTNAKTWIAKTYGDYKSVLQFEDSDKARIIIKGVSPLKTHLNFDTGGKKELSVTYTITFDFKEDRYRILFDNVGIHEYYKFGRNTTPHDSDWPVSHIITTRLPELSIRYNSAQLDSLNALQGLSKQETRKVEKEKRELLKIIEEQQENLAKEQVITDDYTSRFKRIFSDLFNSAAKEISSTTYDDF